MVNTQDLNTCRLPYNKYHGHGPTCASISVMVDWTILAPPYASGELFPDR